MKERVVVGACALIAFLSTSAAWSDTGGGRSRMNNSATVPPSVGDLFGDQSGGPGQGGSAPSAGGGMWDPAQSLLQNSTAQGPVSPSILSPPVVPLPRAVLLGLVCLAAMAIIWRYRRRWLTDVPTAESAPGDRS